MSRSGPITEGAGLLRPGFVGRAHGLYARSARSSCPGHKILRARVGMASHRISWVCAITAIFLLQGLTANASEVWQCKLSPGHGLSPVEFSFEIAGSKIIRSPDDLSSYRQRYSITEHSQDRIVGSSYNVKSNILMEIRINRKNQFGTMIGGTPHRTGFVDWWSGPCARR